HRPLRAAGLGPRLWKRSGGGYGRDRRLSLGHGRRGRRQQRSALPGRRQGGGGVLPRCRRRLRSWQHDGRRLGGGGRVPPGARQRWIHPGADRRDRADVGQRQGGERQGIPPRFELGDPGLHLLDLGGQRERVGQIGLVALPCFRLVAELGVSVADGDQVLGVAFLGIRR